MIRSIRHEKFEDNYFTKNRKLKIEEYDNEGKLIDVMALRMLRHVWKIFKADFINFTWQGWMWEHISEERFLGILYV